MLEELTTLLALSEHGTMTRTASRLHISQSTVSKRIKTLEAALKKTLVEPKGRNVILSPYAEHLAARLRPLLIEMRHVLSEEASDVAGVVSLVIAQHLLVAWGAAVLAQVVKDLPKVKLEIASAAGLGAQEQVQAGERMLAIVRGTGEATPDLGAVLLAEEEAVIVPSGLKPFRLEKQKVVPLMFPEQVGETSGSIKRKLSRWGKKKGVHFEVHSSNLTTASPLLQMARAGFGDCIVSKSLAKTMGINTQQLIALPEREMTIPISILGRRSTLSRPVVQKVIEALKTGIEKAIYNAPK